VPEDISEEEGDDGRQSRWTKWIYSSSLRQLFGGLDSGSGIFLSIQTSASSRELLHLYPFSLFSSLLLVVSMVLEDLHKNEAQCNGSQ
jgi:hypothetical protein